MGLEAERSTRGGRTHIAEIGDASVGLGHRVEAALRVRWDPLVNISGAALLTNLLRNEEVRFVLALVIKTRDVEGATEGAAVVVSTVERSLSRRVKEVARVEHFVA